MIMRKRAALIPILAVFLVAVFLCALPQQAFAVDSRGVGRGTLGLMEYVAGGDFNSIQKQDADLAIRWLTGAESKQAWYDRYVDLGESGDATSIENLENALSYMDAVNGIRKANGLNELKVSLSLMAGAELNCSYSGSIMGHSGAYMTPSGLGSYGSENLAWRSGAFVGSSDPADWSPNDYSVNWPFTGWYTQEKQKYEAGNTDYSSVGHYLNFIASDIESFGFGVGDGAVIWKGSDFEGSFTVSEFKRLVAEYKSTFFIDVYDATAHSEDI